MCDCISTVNKMLADHNTRITLPMIGPRLPFVQTEKLDEKKRGKPFPSRAGAALKSGRPIKTTRHHADRGGLLRYIKSYITICGCH